MGKTDRTWWPEARDHEWIESIARPPHPVLLEMEAVAAPEGIPILSRESGRVLAILAAGRERIVEIGTAIGYSTLWMALALPPAGTIVTVDPDSGRTGRARAFWSRAGIPDERIAVVNAPALQALDAADPALAGPFDLAFIDALKPEYLDYERRLRPRLAPGALLVADNVLWSGRTSGARPSGAGDNAIHLRAFCEAILADPAYDATILPLGDGLLVAALRR